MPRSIRVFMRKPRWVNYRFSDGGRVRMRKRITAGRFVPELMILLDTLKDRGEDVWVDYEAMGPRVEVVSLGHLLYRHKFRSADEFAGITEQGGPLGVDTLAALESAHASKTATAQARAEFLRKVHDGSHIMSQAESKQLTRDLAGLLLRNRLFS